MRKVLVSIAAGTLCVCMLSLSGSATERSSSSRYRQDFLEFVENFLGVNEAAAEEKPAYSGFLEDYAGFVDQPDKNLLYNYVYQKPDADLSAYTKFLIDSITIFPHPEADFKGINANDLTLLQKYFHEAMVTALTEGNTYEIVEEPGPGVARLRVAMTDLVPVRPTLNTLTTWVPQMRLMSGIVGAATGSNFFVGQIGIEAEFIDAESHERIIAVVSTAPSELVTSSTAKWNRSNFVDRR